MSCPQTTSQAHAPHYIQSPCSADPSPLTFLFTATNFLVSVLYKARVEAFSRDPVTMPNRGRRNSQKSSRTYQNLAAKPLNTEQTNY